MCGSGPRARALPAGSRSVNRSCKTLMATVRPPGGYRETADRAPMPPEGCRRVVVCCGHPQASVRFIGSFLRPNASGPIGWCRRNPTGCRVIFHLLRHKPNTLCLTRDPKGRIHCQDGTYDLVGETAFGAGRSTKMSGAERGRILRPGGGTLSISASCRTALADWTPTTSATSCS